METCGFISCFLRGSISINGYTLFCLNQLQGHPEEVYAVEWLLDNHEQTNVEAAGSTNSPNNLLVASECSLFVWDLEKETKIKLDTPQPVVDSSTVNGMPERWREGYIFGTLFFYFLNVCLEERWIVVSS